MSKESALAVLNNVGKKYDIRVSKQFSQRSEETRKKESYGNSKNYNGTSGGSHTGLLPNKEEENWDSDSEEKEGKTPNNGGGHRNICDHSVKKDHDNTENLKAKRRDNGTDSQKKSDAGSFGPRPTGGSFGPRPSVGSFGSRPSDSDRRKSMPVPKTYDNKWQQNQKRESENFDTEKSWKSERSESFQSRGGSSHRNSLGGPYNNRKWDSHKRDGYSLNQRDSVSHNQRDGYSHSQTHNQRDSYYHHQRERDSYSQNQERQRSLGPQKSQSQSSGGINETYEESWDGDEDTSSSLQNEPWMQRGTPEVQSDSGIKQGDKTVRKTVTAPLRKRNDKYESVNEYRSGMGEDRSHFEFENKSKENCDVVLRDINDKSTCTEKYVTKWMSECKMDSASEGSSLQEKRINNSETVKDQQCPNEESKSSVNHSEIEVKKLR